MSSKIDVVIIGGGFYGCMIALYLKQFFEKVLIIEKEDRLLTQASYNNQARVHNGYHYPRSFLTALRSHKNFKKFQKDFGKSICKDYKLIYAIAANTSKTTSLQFLKFVENIGSYIKVASQDTKALFNPHLVEEVFEVDEYIFDAVTLAKTLGQLLDEAGVQILYESEVYKVEKYKEEKLSIVLGNGTTVHTKYALNCAYSQINQILKNSNLPTLPLKHELIEMPIIDVPLQFKKFGVTIMDGPFFGFLPFPDKNLHTFYHVRYTPRLIWSDDEHKTQINKDRIRSTSNYLYMIKDAQRYIPSLEQASYKESLFEVRTVLFQTEYSDARPILLKKNYGLKNFHVILGGKLDNVYDVLQETKRALC